MESHSDFSWEEPFFDKHVVDLASQLAAFLRSHPQEKTRIHPYLTILLSVIPGVKKNVPYPADWVVDLPLLKNELIRLLHLTDDYRHGESFRSLIEQHCPEKDTPTRSTIFRKSRAQSIPLPVVSHPDNTSERPSTPIHESISEAPSAPFPSSRVKETEIPAIPLMPLARVKGKQTTKPDKRKGKQPEEIPLPDSDEDMGSDLRSTSAGPSGALGRHQWISHENLDNVIPPIYDSIQRAEDRISTFEAHIKSINEAMHMSEKRMDNRFTAIDNRFSTMENTMNEGFQRMEGMFMNLAKSHVTQPEIPTRNLFQPHQESIPAPISSMERPRSTLLYPSVRGLSEPIQPVGNPPDFSQPNPQTSYSVPSYRPIPRQMDPPSSDPLGRSFPREKSDFKPKDIGYFDPQDQGPLVEVKDKVQVYRNVFSFTNRLRVKAHFMDLRILRERLDECLLGRADTWYNQELDHLRRIGLRADETGITEWCKALETRFRQPPGQSLRILEALQYTLSDVYDQKDPLDFIQKIVVHGINSGIAVAEHQQAQLAYNHFDVRLRMTLTEPTNQTPLSAFIDQVNQRKHQWFDRYRRREPRQRYTSKTPGKSDDQFKPRNTSGGYRERSSFKARNDYEKNDRRENTRQGTGNSNEKTRHGSKPAEKERQSKVYQAITDSESGTEEAEEEPDDTSDSDDDVAANSVHLIDSKAPVASDTGRDYKLWHYVRLNLRLNIDKPSTQVCFDTGCTMSLIDKEFLKEQTEDKVKSRALPIPIMVKGIEARRQPCTEYAILDMYVNGDLPDGKPAVAHIRREVHVVDKLGPHMLIGMDIIGPEQINFDVIKKKVTFHRHNDMTAPVTVDPPEYPNRQRKVHTTKKIVVPAHTVTTMPVQLKSKQPLTDEKTYLFSPTYNGITEALQNKGGIYNHLVDSNFSFVHVKNDTDNDMVIPRHTRVGYVELISEEECYTVDAADQVFAMDLATLPELTTLPEPEEMEQVKDSLAEKSPSPKENPPVRSFAQTLMPEPLTAKPLAAEHQFVTSNGITVYAESQENLEELLKILNEFQELFAEKPGLAMTDELLRIPLKDGWQNHKLCTKVYPLSKKDELIVDETFDKLHKQGKMMWPDRSTPFGFPVFVINSTKGATGKTPDEILYGFNPWLPLEETDGEIRHADRLVHLKEAQDALAYGQEVMKRRYDGKHQPLNLQPGDKVYINLHKGYHTQGRIHRKFGAQRVGQFTVQRVIANGNAYEVDLPKHWQIHPVISAEHLEPAPGGKDPFDRSIDDGNIHPLVQEGDNDEWQSWEIEKIVDKRMRKYGRGKPQVEYLVRWKGFGPAYDQWYPVNLLDKAAELVRDYEDSNRH
jgi:hypothetical protein